MRWAFRNAVLFAVVLFGVAIFAHFEVQHRVTEDAKLLLELEVRELVEELGTGALSASQIAEEVDPEIAASHDPDLEIGVQVFDDQRERVYARGRLATLDVTIPRELGSAGSASVFSVIEIENEDPYWVVSAKGVVGYVQVGVSSREFVKSAGQLGRVLVMAAPMLALLAGVMGWWIARQSLAPIREMVRATRGIGFSRLTTRVRASGSGDELDLLAQTLNEAFARVEEGAEKLRQFTADAAHELRTPLTRLRSRLEATLADTEAPRERLWKVLQESLDELPALSETLTATLLLAESDAGLRPELREPVALRRLLEDLVEFYEPMAIEQNVKLHFDAGAEVQVSGIPAWLRQAFANLLQNALAHTSTAVAVRLGALQRGTVEVTIEDDGRGIAPEEVPRIFDRFYRARDEPAAGGTGLGLAIALQMVTAHGGTIDLESRVYRGATFRVTLPCVES
jgi:signal transduction histidine kinase